MITRIKKLRHCCMLIDVSTTEGPRRIMTDPGIFSLEQHDKVAHADIVLITHEHADHFHVESLKAFMKRCPTATIIANDAVGDLLAKEGIPHHVMGDGDTLDLRGVRLAAYGKKHAVIHESLPVVSNVGFFIEDKLFYPGDAFTDPKRAVDVLALPTAAPWLKISESLDYARALKPRIAFPVHDAIVPAGFMHPAIENVLSKNGIEFIKLGDGGEINLA